MSSLAPSLSTLPTLPSDAAAQGTGFNWVGLLVLLVVVAAAVPLYRRLRTKLSEDRKARWAASEGWEFTPENDPDLRRDPPADGAAPGPTGGGRDGGPDAGPDAGPDDPPTRPGGGILR